MGWTLILTVYLASAGTPPATTVVDGFAMESDCKLAGLTYKNAALTSDVKVVWACVERFE